MGFRMGCAFWDSLHGTAALQFSALSLRHETPDLLYIVTSDTEEYLLRWWDFAKKDSSIFHGI